MAIATAMSIGTSNKVTVDYQSQEVSISITFELERGDTDLQALVTDKAAELERAHSAAWRRIRELRTQQKAREAGSVEQAATETPEPKRSRRSRAARGSDNGDAPAQTPEAADAGDESGGSGQCEPEPSGQDCGLASVAQQRAILSLANRAGMDGEGLTTLLREIVGKSVVEQLTRQDAARLLVELQRRDKLAAYPAA